DVDRDGDLDLVAGNGISSTAQPLRLFLNNGTSNPWNGVTGSNVTTDTVKCYAIALGDVDGDGDLDLVAGNSSAPIRWYPNDGVGNPWDTATAQTISTDSRSFWSIALGDLDRDGDLDVVSGVYADVSRYYLNNGTATPFAGVVGADLTGD